MVLKFLNLGCGGRYHPDWVNIDFTAQTESVIAHNLLKGIPAAADTYDVAYHSHLLEHFSKDDAPKFLQECFHVLKPKGILRVVVPDLAAIARQYLLALEKAIAEVPGWDANHDWMLMELFDQTVRNQPGGTMAAYLKQESLPNIDFVIQRLGVEAKEIITAGDQQRQQQLEDSSVRAANPVLENLVKPAYRFIRYSTYRRECFLKAVLGQEYKTLQLGRFRQQGEIHQWMYDRYSLRRLLEQCGFTHVVQHTATTSYVSDWSSFNLDTEPDGSIYKPDSLFMEAVKPSP